MGMDVYGKKKDPKTGEEFYLWRWRPLWDYCLEVSPQIAGKVGGDGHYNGGAGLDEADSRRLAMVLRGEIESGRTAEYAARYAKKNDPFSVENVQEFAEFLENCGGFEIL